MKLKLNILFVFVSLLILQPDIGLDKFAFSALYAQESTIPEVEVRQTNDSKVRRMVKFVPASEEEKISVSAIPDDQTDLLKNTVDKYKDLKKYELVVIAQEKLTKTNPSYDNFYDLAIYNSSVGDFRNAIISCTDALVIGTGEEITYMYCYVLRAIYLGAIEKYDEAVQDLMTVLNSDDKETKVFVFQDLVAAPVYPLLRKEIQKERDKDIENPRWLLYMGKAYEVEKDYPNAIAQYEACYDISRDFLLFKLIGKCYEKAGDLENATLYKDKYESILRDLLWK